MRQNPTWKQNMLGLGVVVWIDICGKSWGRVKDKYGYKAVEALWKGDIVFCYPRNDRLCLHSISTHDGLATQPVHRGALCEMYMYTHSF